MVKINGKHAELAAGTTVAQYLREHGYNIGRIALEYNGEILPKTKFGDTVIRETDVIEIVSFVGGG